MNKYPFWKYLIIVAVMAVGLIYSVPNLYGNQPALQISSTVKSGAETLQLIVEAALEMSDVKFDKLYVDELDQRINLLFENSVDQIRARDALEESLGDEYTIALNLASAQPEWLRRLAAEPMFLGLDLRGGIHFLMEVDMDAALIKTLEGHVSDIRTLLRERKIRYKTLRLLPDESILVRLRDSSDAEALDEAEKLILREKSDLSSERVENENGVALVFRQSAEAWKENREQALKQNIITLRNRVNELGVAEPVVQQQGADRIVVQLPGVSDTARAKEILGATATLEFRMVDEDNDAEQAEKSGTAPIGSRLYRTRSREPVLLKRDIIITGDRIVDASSGLDSETGSPAVFITLDGQGARQMGRKTSSEVGNMMGVVFVETHSWDDVENGEKVRRRETREEVINIARINEQLSKRFQITGLDSSEESRNLSLLLRAGSLSAPVDIIEERTVGPSLGQDNIDRGMLSIQLGLLLVLIFMVVYYRIFGLIADIALASNLILLVALLSILQATLTLPGIAGIVLTVGMAVDANVLIFSRIREELRNGNSPHASIQAGYDKAFSTIADANITTLIAALVLFGFGTGPIKGFAVTLSLGILTSMFTSIMVTRSIVNLAFGDRPLKSLPI